MDFASTVGAQSASTVFDDSGALPTDAKRKNHHQMVPKRRVIKSCVNCHRRKVKCDKIIPCSNCDRLDLTCEYYTDKSANPSQKRADFSVNNEYEDCDLNNKNSPEVNVTKVRSTRTVNHPIATPTRKIEPGYLTVDTNTGQSRYTNGVFWGAYFKEVRCPLYFIP